MFTHVDVCNLVNICIFNSVCMSCTVHVCLYVGVHVSVHVFMCSLENIITRGNEGLCVCVFYACYVIFCIYMHH